MNLNELKEFAKYRWASKCSHEKLCEVIKELVAMVEKLEEEVDYMRDA